MILLNLGGGGEYGILCLLISVEYTGVLRIRIWRIFICDVIELTTALECQKQLLMSGISNLGGHESLEIAVMIIFEM